MTITLTVTRYQNTTPDHAPSVSAGPEGCTIGRVADNDLSLADPARTISSHHARVDFRDGRFYLTDLSTNGTVVNNGPAPVGKGNTVPLADGDVLTIGAYEVRVAVAAQAAGGTLPPLGALGEEEETPDPLDLIGGAPRKDSIPDDFGLDLGSGPAPGAEPLGGSAPSGGGAIPDDFDLGGGEALEQVPADQEAFRPPRPLPEGWDDTGPVEAAPPPEAPAPPAPEEPAAPEPVAAPAAPRPAAPEPAAEAPGGPPPAQVTDAVGAFLRAAGIDPADVPPEQWPRLMETAGAVLRETVQGLTRTLAARTAFKREMRMDVTTIQPVENNPLKFSVDVDDALRYLLVREARGFLPPVRAVQEGFADVQAHQVAVMSALRAALETLVGRFDPGRLEHGFARHSKLDQLLPMARKAKCWDVFTETYGALAKDAQDGFMDLLEHAFAEAYAQQIKDLKKPDDPH
jgi:type VI secretion system protein